MNVGDRIKDHYEDRTRMKLMRRMITIIRLDGKGFSKFTSGMNKPFDDGFSDDMDETAKYLCEQIQGAKIGYTQSDEITIVLTDYDNRDTSAWFDNNIQKMVSVSASIATAKFNQLRTLRLANNSYIDSDNVIDNELAMFDSRVFQVPTVDEMVNVMIFRQQDCTRNSISMAADAVVGGDMTGVKSGDKQEMMFQKGVNWNDYKTKYKRGSVVKKIEADLNGVIRSRWVIDSETPIFTENKEYLTELMPK